jgi:predicted nucleic acid-binding protein
VKAFLDTSVLVASFYEDHLHHEPSFRLLCEQDQSIGCTAAHCLVEVYAVLTAMPGRSRAGSDEALLFLQDVRARLSTITLEERDYFAVLDDAAGVGIAGGAVSDALIARCAIKAETQAIYTWNLKHFTRFGAGVSGRVRAP